jgi:hypothetical protein
MAPDAVVTIPLDGSSTLSSELDDRISGIWTDLALYVAATIGIHEESRDGRCADVCLYFVACKGGSGGD